MWYDLDKAAEGIMRSADLAIKAAEQSATEPPWDGAWCFLQETLFLQTVSVSIRAVCMYVKDI